MFDLTNQGTEAWNLALFARELELNQIPADVQTLAKEHLLDALGIALASSGFEFGKVIADAGQKLGAGNEATVIGFGSKLPATSAALVNGVLAHGLDFDDTHIGAIYHASAPALAAVLASAEASGCTGAEALTAFVIALEVGCRLATAGAGKLHDRSFHPTSLCGTFAAACAAGRIQRLSQESLVSALGLCGSMASGILERGNSWLKRMHPGWAAHSGLSAVALGASGFLGPDSVLEGRRGFYFAHIGEIPAGSNLPSHDLGEVWQTRGIALKPYPCCHFTHAFADAALALRGQFNLDEVERIDCPLTASMHKMVAEPRERCVRPTTPYAALFSVQYVVAAALVKGRVDLPLFYDEPLDDPAVLSLAEKIHCVDDPRSDYPAHFPGEVVAYLKSGRVLRLRRPASLGTPEVPLTRQQIESKFLSLATRVIPQRQAERVCDIALDLEHEQSLSALMKLLVVR